MFANLSARTHGLSECYNMTQPSTTTANALTLEDDGVQFTFFSSWYSTDVLTKAP